MQRIDRRKLHEFSLLALIALFATSLSACDDPAAPDYRYRLTVEVDTPEGLETGSSVIEVKQTLGRAGGAPASSQIYTRMRGEAVAVDLPGGRTLFALLRSDNNSQWAGTIVSALTPQTVGSGGEARFDGVLRLKGEKEVPRRYPRAPRLSAYPMLVTFGDIDDPTSVAKVDPDDLAATFGEGVELKRITVQLTDAPVTTGIEKRLGWLRPYGEKHGALKPSGSSFLSDATPINLVSPNDFSTELYK